MRGVRKNCIHSCIKKKVHCTMMMSLNQENMIDNIMVVWKFEEYAYKCMALRLDYHAWITVTQWKIKVINKSSQSIWFIQSGITVMDKIKLLWGVVNQRSQSELSREIKAILLVVETIGTGQPHMRLCLPMSRWQFGQVWWTSLQLSTHSGMNEHSHNLWTWESNYM